jgi:hypothetical protein
MELDTFFFKQETQHIDFIIRASFESICGGLPIGQRSIGIVLHHALKRKVFVLYVHGFLEQYGRGSKGLPTERIWVYDRHQECEMLITFGISEMLQLFFDS